MNALNNIQRMTNVIEDKHETAIPSKYVWRQARAMETLEHWRLGVLVHGNQFAVRLGNASFFERGITDTQAEKMHRLFDEATFFQSPLDAVEFFLKTLEEVKVAK